MNIKFRQTGGFAGLTKSANLDADQMPDNEAGMLRTWVEQANFWSMPNPSGRSQPDQEQYSITIEAEGRSRTVHMGHSAVPTGLKPLVDFLRSKANYDKRG